MNAICFRRLLFVLKIIWDYPLLISRFVGGHPLRDDALICKRVLRKEYDIKTKLDVCPGLLYDFQAFFLTLKSADKFCRDNINSMGYVRSGTLPPWSRNIAGIAFRLVLQAVPIYKFLSYQDSFWDERQRWRKSIPVTRFVIQKCR